MAEKVPQPKPAEKPACKTCPLWTNTIRGWGVCHASPPIPSPHDALGYIETISPENYWCRLHPSYKSGGRP